jgi:DNA-directed RNA polymerase specialized sigma24 family protein
MNIWDAALGRVKAELDLKQWQMFDLYVLKEWPVREVAQALGVSIGRVYLTKHRVSALVKREVKRIGRTGSEPRSHPAPPMFGKSNGC